MQYANDAHKRYPGVHEGKSKSKDRNEAQKTGRKVKLSQQKHKRFEYKAISNKGYKRLIPRTTTIK